MSTASITTDELISRGIVEVIDENHLRRVLASGKKLRVKFGIDPTAREIHLGHGVPIRLLKRFQILGHKVVFIVGDFTATIGDPSGLTQSRPALSFRQTRENAKTYFDQAFKILDPDLTEIHYNSEWHNNFDLRKVIHLLSHVSVAQLLAHDTFRERLKKEQPFFAHEILYPLLQGYDSVAVKADVEVGGLDQKFNLLMGREVQKAHGLAPQDVILLDYLVGTDGREKMSKSLGNYIAITDSPGEMYGKVMSIPDEQIVPYFKLTTDVTDEAITLIEKELTGGRNPRDLKMRLAATIVELYHGPEEAKEAAEAFGTKFRRKGLPGRAESAKPPQVFDWEVTVPKGRYSLADLLLLVRLAKSKSEARRKLAEGAVDIFVGEKVEKIAEKIVISGPTTIRLGKRFVRVIPR